MAKVIWFGDSRIEQLKRAQSDITPKDIKDKYSFSYITEEEADYSWFSSRFKSDMSKVTLTVDDSVVINLGFFDCLYSAIWPAYNALDIAASYVKLLDNIVSIIDALSFISDFCILLTLLSTVNNSVECFNVCLSSFLTFLSNNF